MRALTIIQLTDAGGNIGDFEDVLRVVGVFHQEILIAVRGQRLQRWRKKQQEDEHEGMQ